LSHDIYSSFLFFLDLNVIAKRETGSEQRKQVPNGDRNASIYSAFSFALDILRQSEE
jgi:hypothetical protein